MHRTGSGLKQEEVWNELNVEALEDSVDLHLEGWYLVEYWEWSRFEYSESEDWECSRFDCSGLEDWECSQSDCSGSEDWERSLFEYSGSEDWECL